MKRIVVIIAIAGLFALAAGCGARGGGKEAGLPSFLAALGELEEADRGNGIVALVRASASLPGMDAAALDRAENGFEYMENAGEYRRDVVVFGITGFLDISVENGKIKEANYYLSEHADGYDQAETRLLENVVSEYGDPASVLFHDEAIDGIERIKEEYSAEDEYSAIKYICAWENIDGENHSFILEKEFSMFQNRNMSRYLFS